MFYDDWTDNYFLHIVLRFNIDVKTVNSAQIIQAFKRLQFFLRVLNY